MENKEMVMFYSNSLEKEIEAEVIEKRAKTWKLKLPQSMFKRKIQIKEQYKTAKKGVYQFRILTKFKMVAKPERFIIKKIKQL